MLYLFCGPAKIGEGVIFRREIVEISVVTPFQYNIILLLCQEKSDKFLKKMVILLHITPSFL